ncbi:MAG: serine/threonine protein kinase [Intrasporangium sp.]|uniref:protein kinase domain-containing protein n=1 Tax=Intrasporangium sp. TaxID=1925024 RepID=UPI0026489028|nr:serine/threonine-protein kinase [Intrasporangium sp.]MDN5797776.1 serine/threonine protein kinase [Intrasporangium sp.]
MDEDSTDRPVVPGHDLLHVIGSGSTSVVWSAVDATGRPVAVKVPRTDVDPVAVREAEIERHVLMAVRHEHIVALRDVVPLADGRVAHVFDLVVGTTLASLVASRGHLRPGEAVTVLTPIAQAIGCLHAAGGTHCDVSPGNVMLTADGRPLLADLGAARLAGAGAGAVVGTAGFTAPEVRSGGRPTEASDVFSLGALAWYCLTGNGAPDTFMRLSDETVRSHVGAELAEVVRRCIDPDPEARPASDALPTLFYGAVGAEPVEVVVGADAAAALTHRIRAEAAAQAAPTTEPAGPWFRRVRIEPPRWWPRLAVVAAVAGLAVALGWLTHLGLVPGARASSDPVPAGGPPVSSTTAPRSSVLAPAPDHTSSPPSARPSQPDARALLQGLTDRRVAALVAREQGSLADVHRPQSPSWRADAAVIADLRSAHQRYSGLRMRVVEADFLDRSATRTVVRASVAVAPYDLVDRQGRAVSKGADEGRPLDFHLIRTDAGWRIESITDPRAT